ncbi:MAG: hypothetical protein ABSH34_30635 [Verrucomicrobiota bacterium]
MSATGKVSPDLGCLSAGNESIPRLIREAALSGIKGGTIYDAPLLQCAAKTGAEKVLTLNLKHFQTIAPENIRSQISAP